MKCIIIFSLFLIEIQANIPCPSRTMMQYLTLSQNDLPLCGNGILDPGEVCDDGNRVGGDGCNGWCSAFDRMTKACTLAGQNRECVRSTTLASSPSQTSFCNLNAIAISPDGKYLVVADGVTLVQMDLFTDSVMNNLYILPASGTADFGKFSSLHIFTSSLSTIIGKDTVENIILAHDCVKQNIVAFVYGGSTSVVKATLPLSSSEQTNPSGYLDTEANLLLIAGLPLIKDGLRCVELYSIDLDTYNMAVLGGVDCVAFDVIENGITYPSFSMDGMVPYRVLRE